MYTEAEPKCWFSDTLKVLIYQSKLRPFRYHKTQHFDSARVYLRTLAKAIKEIKEIDLIIETGDSFYPVEFKKTATPSQTASKHFHLLEKLGKKVGHGVVLCFVERDIPLSRTVTVVPVGYL